MRKLLLLGCLLLPGWAAQAQNTSFPTKPPADLTLRSIKLPPIYRETLPNGLKVVVLEQRRVPIVTVALGIPAGMTAVPPGRAGLEDTVATMIEQGTTKMDLKQVAEKAQNLGGTVRLTASNDTAAMTGSAAAKNSGALFSLMAEVLFKPKFDHDLLESYLLSMEARRQAERVGASGSPSKQFTKALYGSHPYGRVEGTEASIRETTPEVVREFYNKNYRPNGSVLTIVGDVDTKTILQQVKAAFGDWKKVPQSAAKPIPPLEMQPLNRVWLLDRPKSVQANVLIGNAAVNISEKDTFALDVANAIIGGKTDSRLFAVVREKLGYAYSIHSDVENNALASEFQVQVECRTAVTIKTIQQIIKEVEQLGNELVGERELASAKGYIVGRFVQALGSQAGLVNLVMDAEYFNRPPTYLETYRDKVMAITAADVQRVARKYLLPGRAAIVVVGDKRELQGEIGKVGQVETTP